MTNRTKSIVLVVLLLMLAGAAFNFYRTRYASDDSTPPPVSLDAKFTPLNVDNPALRMDILKRFLALEYTGVHRSIFSAKMPPPPTPPVTRPVIAETGPPPGPPPLTVDAKYFGYVSDPRGDHRRAFFSSGNNDDIIIAGEGDTLLGRFRVVRLTTTSADVEEVSTGRRATLNLEEPPPAG
ncbi:MAG TPA: hypothetical protein VKT71_03465 [Candidatus Acidoferrales bacterium]|nr:hypothetical protein [Candidatus Acidoferrales bacterium]